MICQENPGEQYNIARTDNKNPFLCQVKNNYFLSYPLDIPLLISFSSVWPSWLPSLP
jgi:hypothetical protein